MVSGANGYFSLVRGTPFGPQVNPSPPRRQDDEDYIVAARIRSVRGDAAEDVPADADDAGAVDGAQEEAGEALADGAADADDAGGETTAAEEAVAEPEPGTDVAESPEAAEAPADEPSPEGEPGAEPDSEAEETESTEPAEPAGLPQTRRSRGSLRTGQPNAPPPAVESGASAQEPNLTGGRDRTGGAGGRRVHGDNQRGFGLRDRGVLREPDRRAGRVG